MCVDFVDNLVDWCKIVHLFLFYHTTYGFEYFIFNKLIMVLGAFLIQQPLLLMSY